MRPWGNDYIWDHKPYRCYDLVVRLPIDLRMVWLGVVANNRVKRRCVIGNVRFK